MDWPLVVIVGALVVGLIVQTVRVRRWQARYLHVGEAWQQERELWERGIRCPACASGKHMRCEIFARCECQCPGRPKPEMFGLCEDCVNKGDALKNFVLDQRDEAWRELDRFIAEDRKERRGEPWPALVRFLRDTGEVVTLRVRWMAAFGKDHHSLTSGAAWEISRLSYLGKVETRTGGINAETLTRLRMADGKSPEEVICDEMGKALVRMVKDARSSYGADPLPASPAEKGAKS